MPSKVLKSDLLTFGTHWSCNASIGACVGVDVGKKVGAVVGLDVGGCVGLNVGGGVGLDVGGIVLSYILHDPPSAVEKEKHVHWSLYLVSLLHKYSQSPSLAARGAYQPFMSEKR